MWFSARAGRRALLLCLASHVCALKMCSAALGCFILYAICGGRLVLGSKSPCMLFLRENINTYWAPCGFRGKLLTCIC